MSPRKSASNGVSSSQSTGELSSFETEFGRLGSIVERLESGNLPLEEMLKLYEEGMTLSQKLNTTLSEAELQVKKLALIHEEMTTATVLDVAEENADLDSDDEGDPF